MHEIFLVVTMTYGVSLSFGYMLQKYFKMPWMFASLFFGLLLSQASFLNPTIQSNQFKLFETLGMYFLLFIIGFSLDLKKIQRLRNQVVLGAFLIVGFEGVFGSLLLYCIFPAEVHHSYIIALVTALSFATVGEVVLLPILRTFGIIKTTFGQLTLGIGTLDDIVEVIMLTVVAILSTKYAPFNQTGEIPIPEYIILGLIGLLVISVVLMKSGRGIKRMLSKNHPPDYVCSLLTLLVCFSFISLGGVIHENLAAVGAIFGGMTLRALLPKERLYQNERAVEFLGYVFLSPLFFLSVGASVSLNTLLIYPSLIVSIWIVAKGSKLLASFILFRKLLGNKHSLLLGIGLSVRFSTSLIILFMLLNSGLISLALYSALIATAIFMKPVIVGIYSWGLSRGRPP